MDLTIDATLAGTIATALNGGSNVTQQTSATGTGGNGDITVASGISWSTSATLTLSAYRNIAVNANITSTGGGGVVLRADNAGTGTGTVTFGGGQVSTAGTVSIFYNPTGSNSTVNATKYTAPTQTSFSGNVTGGATLNTNMLVNTVYDLQNIQNNLAGIYALGRDIDASATASWNGGAGFTPVGGISLFTGTFDGQGQTISNLRINQPSGQYVGLFGWNGATAIVRNLGLLNVSITGGTATGGVVGRNEGTITGVYTSGSVTSSAGAGGIVGYNYGPLSNVYSTATVSAPSIYAGGIAGLSVNANISRAYATGAVSGGQNVGGLVGYFAGGLVTQSYATGAVSGTSGVGGLLGYNGGSITQSYWDSYTTGQAGGIGTGTASSGVTAVTSDPAQSAAANYAFKQSAYVGFNFTAGNELYRLVLDRWPDPSIRPVGIFDQYRKRAPASVDGDESRCELQAHIQHRLLERPCRRRQISRHVVVGGLRPDRQHRHEIHRSVQRPRVHHCQPDHQSADHRRCRAVWVCRRGRNGAGRRVCWAPQ